jgi:BirA family biotin operon repressor/biotin-[acetyl-CoA-carboxylase] ligase
VPLSQAEIAPQLGMAAAVAVAETLSSLCGLDARLKWPNDVLINGRKIAGVLVEFVASATQAPAGIVGIGVNLQVERFPAALEQAATSARIEGRPLSDLDSFERALRSSLFALTGELDRGDLAAIVRRWRLRDDTAGRRYAVSGKTGVSGLAEGISDSGALRLRIADDRTVEVISATSAE